MIILTDKKLVIPVGIAPNYAGAGNTDIKLQSKSVTITENGSKTLFPDGNYDGFSQVNINTNVPNNPVLEDKSVEISENGDYRFTPGPAYDGIGNFRLKVNVESHEPIHVESVKTAYPSFEQDVTVVPSDGYEAMSSVIVKKAEVNLQTKSVTINENGSTSFTPDDNFMGLSKIDITTNVELNPVLETRSEQITENGSYKFTPSPDYDGIGNLDLVVNVDVNDPTRVESSKTAYPSFEQDVTVTPSEGFDAMGTVIVKKAEPNLQDKTVDKASTSEVVLSADEGYQGLGTVTVAPIKTKTVTADPSTNVQEFSANTENNEYITNVTVNPVNARSINVDPSTNYQEYSANTENNEYITYVTVNRIGTKTVTADPSTNVQEFSANTENNEYITSVTVNPVGTKTVNVDPSTNVQTVNANVEGNEYITSVTVNPVVTKTVNIDSSTNAQTVNANTEGNEYITSVTVNPVKTKSLSITPRLVEQTFTAEQELYNTVNVSAIKNTEKTYDASTNTQTYDYAENNDVFIKNLTINPVTSSIDPNIVPENIAKGVSILGVDGTLEQSSSDTTLIKGTGAPYSAKLKVYQVYLEDKNDTNYDVFNSDAGAVVDLKSGDAGTSGYIPFFMKNFGSSHPNVSAKLGTLEERGITAVVVNGVVYENPTSFNIPYTKVNDGSTNYDDVTVDVYIDFTKSNALAERIEKGVVTGTDQNFDVNTYKYLPPIFNENFGEYYNEGGPFIYVTVETTVREPVNALSQLFLTHGDNGLYNTGDFTFLVGEGGLIRVAPQPEGMLYQANPFNKVTIYGDVNNFGNLRKWFYRTNTIIVHGDVNDYDLETPIPSSAKKSKLYGDVKPLNGSYSDSSGGYIVDTFHYPICHFYEGVIVNLTSWEGIEINAEAVIMPSTLKTLHASTTSGIYRRWYYGAITYVFFGKTPPSLGKAEPKLKSVSGNTSRDEHNNLERIYIPAGADYSSIIDSNNPPDIIEFTPISSMNKINGPGIYGLINEQLIFEIKSSTQAEQDLQTVATEINTL